MSGAKSWDLKLRTCALWTPHKDIWKPQKVYNDGIYLVYTRHMTTYSIYLEYTWYIPVIWQRMSYDRYIPGIYQKRLLVYTWYIPVIEMPFYTGYIPGIYLSHEIVRSARLQNCDWNAAVHRYWIARVFNVLQNVAAVPLGICQPAWGPGSGQTRAPAAKSRRLRRWNRRHRRPLQRRRGRAAAAADADVGGGGGVTQPPPTPTAAAGWAHRRRWRRGRRSESLVDWCRVQTRMTSSSAQCTCRHTNQLAWMCRLTKGANNRTNRW